MLTFTLRITTFLQAKIVWFGHKPNPWSCLFTIYRQSSYCKPAFGYKRRSFYTKVVDLNQTEESLLKGFKKNTIYEITRAHREGVETMLADERAEFHDFYNQFALTKKLSPLTLKKLDQYGPALIITKAAYKGEKVAMHAYVADHSLRKVRLLYSASLFRQEAKNDDRSAIGRANRYLHFKDMLYFRSLGFSEYDLGGYAVDTASPELTGINHFKDGFSGILREESDFLPLPVRLFFKNK